MKRILLLIPSGHDVGLTSISLGLYRSLEKQGYKVGFFKPIAQNDSDHEKETERSISIIRQHNPNSFVPDPIELKEAESLLRSGNDQDLMEKVVENLYSVDKDAEVIVAEGLVAAKELFYAKHLNDLMAKSLDAEIILVSAPNGKDPEETVEALEIEALNFRKMGSLAGCVINKIGRKSAGQNLEKTTLPHTREHNFGKNLTPSISKSKLDAYRKEAENANFTVLATVPWNQKFAAPRLSDFVSSLDAHYVRKGNHKKIRVRSVSFCTMTLAKSLYHLQADTLIVTTSDRSDIILAAAMAYLDGVKIAGILLCGNYEIDQNTLILCEKAFNKGLPILATSNNTYQIAAQIANTRIEIPSDDNEKVEQTMQTISASFSSKWIKSILKTQREHRMSSPEFRGNLIKLAKKASKRIILPEGEEERTIKAAIVCASRGIASPILVGNKEKIIANAQTQGFTLPASIEIIEPGNPDQKYIDKMVELRAHKGMTAEKASEELKDPITLSTMMLKMDEVDGLVAGAINTSAAVVRPAMQLIKTAPGSNLVSSIFFMGMPNQMLVFGDCAVNQDPNAEQLAQIAIQSADTATTFNIPARVAMISYSTGKSGSGADVDKVREAVRIVKETRPDILVDGPLQYDAAMIKSVAASKAPESPVAGRATVLIFPDLNTGNTTYKAVQRSANVVSIGPMLQGLAKPINDLSRGALVEDILYTIALTAIQASQLAEKS